MSGADTAKAGHVLLADIGGTNARFALADTSSETPLIVDSVEGFSVADFPSLADAAKHYLDQTGATAQNGVFAVAGRVEGDVARITNHPWVISRSRTRDTDFAKETAELTRTPILQQAGTAMLAQANQVPQNVMSLLR